METKKVLASAIVGTSAMTLFSYVVSELQDESFQEPERLAKFLRRSPLSLEEKEAILGGWASHYVIGLFFASVYSQLWKSNILKPTIRNGLCLGAVSGACGILGWELAFIMHPNPPSKDLKKYYGHLLAAHVIFGAFAVAGYNLMQNKKSNNKSSR